jgi:hypothetical protein
MQYERLVLLVLALFGVVIGTYVSFKSGNYGYILGFALLPFLVLLIGQARLLFMLVLITFNSGLRIPYLPGQLELWHVLALALAGLLFLGKIINKQTNPHPPILKYCLIGFGLLLLATMLVRGTGFKMLGDSKWGGVRYIALYIGIFMLYHSGAVRLNTRQWMISIIGMQVAAYLPFLSELVFLKSQGAISAHYYFFKFQGSTGFNMDAFAAGDEHGRYQQGGPAAAATLIAAFILAPFKGKGKALYIFAGIVAFTLVGLSGHRLGFVINLLFLFIYGLVTTRKHPIPFIITTASVSIFACIMAIVFVQYLPFTYQRALSWLPFAEIDRVAAIDADSTTEWRLQIWADAVHEIPEFLWIGKGYAYDVYAIDALRLHPVEYQRLWAPIAVSYHSGPLSLIIGMGLAGFILGSTILIYTIIRHWRLVSMKWENKWLYRIHLVIMVRYYSLVISFFLFYGDVFNSFPKLLMHVMILEGVVMTNRLIAQERRAKEVPSGEDLDAAPRSRIRPNAA